ncbi:MAG: BadF/BadG/BcrA/BcrD ATPase family protein, partial [Oscillospiraceae bacterium]
MSLKSKLLIGLDIGSTTIKCVVLDGEKVVYKDYQRHLSCIIEKTKEIIEKCFINLSFTYNDNTLFSISISGSAGMGIATSCDINFIQEVFATRIAAKKYIKNTDCIIELGGEDAKILFLTGATEVRMNGSCAGGTGAFIDQMATLLNMTPSQMN